MRTIHHVIVAAMDVGMPEVEAESLAAEILGSEQPFALLESKIEVVDSQLQTLTNLRKALEAIRTKCAVSNGDSNYNNLEDTARLRQ